MPRWSDAIDRRPGALPEIRAEGDQIIFELMVTIGGRDDKPVRLVLRCTQDDVLAAINRHPRPRIGGPSF